MGLDMYPPVRGGGGGGEGSTSNLQVRRTLFPPGTFSPAVLCDGFAASAIRALRQLIDSVCLVSVAFVRYRLDYHQTPYP